MLTPGGTTSTRQREALDEVEAELRAILVRYESKLETAAIYGMEVLRRPGTKAHDWFAGVEQTNGVVKFNFLPMHAHPELLEGVSPELLKHRTGASVFKFTEPDKELVKELAGVVARGYKVYAARRKKRPTP
jgi:hypothetical protein